MSAITDRILKQIGDQEIIEKLLSLSKADLNSFLLELFERQTDTISPIDVLKVYRSNRFTVPSAADPIKFHALETELLSAARDMDIKPVLLSPAAPLGSCSSFGCVDQYNVISALRGTETLSDPSNMLAIIIADKLKSHSESNSSPLHYATTVRAVRAQVFSGKGAFPHFGLFCMVSSGKDTGSYASEKELLQKHLTFYKELLQKQFKGKLSILLRKRSGYTDVDGFFDKMSNVIKQMFPDTPFSFDDDDVDNRYYKGINFKIHMELDNEKIEIGDGGFVDWMEQMLGSKKERCLISGIGLERFVAVNPYFEQICLECKRADKSQEQSR